MAAALGVDFTITPHKPLTVRPHSPEQCENLKKEQGRAWTIVDQVRERNADKAPEEVLRDVTAEVEAVRREPDEEEERTAKRRR